MAFDILSFILGKRSVVPAVLQEKNVVPTAEGAEVVPDEGFNGLSKVNVSGDANLVPENIVSGTSIFGVEGTAGSGGGGSFPPGLYFESDGMGAPEAKRRSFFSYNDNTYCISAVTDGSNGATIYKYVNGAWESVLVSSDMHRFAYQTSPLIGVLNGKAHLKAYNQHWTFDGTTLTALANFTSSDAKVFIADGKLMYYYQYEFYVWDEATDTWTLEGTTSYSPTYFWTVEGKAYARDNKAKLYVYNNNTLEDTGFVFSFGGVVSCVIGKKAYYTYGATINRQVSLYVLDYETMTETKIGVFPYVNISNVEYSHFYVDNGKLRFFSTHAGVPINFLVHYIPA